MLKAKMITEEKNSKVFRIIRVAILAEEPLGWGSGKHYFISILTHQWKKENMVYQFIPTYLFDRDIVKGKLTIQNFDVLLVPGGGVGDGESIVKGFSYLPKVKKWKKAISEFIKNGGGYVGICGGSALFTPLETERGKPKTFLEKRYDRSAIGISTIKSYYKDIAFPLFYPFQLRHPEIVGATAYIFSFSPGKTQDGKYLHTGGVPIDFYINRNHPIFSDVPYPTIRIRWWGGPGLIVPETHRNEVEELAWYPEDAFSEKTSTSIAAWRYTGGLLGLLNGLRKACRVIRENKESLKNLFLYTYFLAGTWEKTCNQIDMNLAKKASITAEIYQNEHKGRIILCSAHPEYMIWWGGYIEEESEKRDSCIGKGFHRWHEIKPLSANIADELTATWWIVRRFVAWAAKIPDDHMPPIEKGVITENEQKILSENIFWNQTLLNQMKNI